MARNTGGGAAPPPILHVAIDASPVRNGRTGVGRYAEQLIAHLGELPLRVTPLVNRRDVGGRRLPLRPTLLWLQLVAPRTIRSSGARVAHFTTGRAPLFCPVPYVLTVHDLTVLDHPEWYARRERVLVAPWLRASIRRAAAIIAVSADTARAVERRFPTAAGRIRIIPEAAAPEFLTPRSPDLVAQTLGAYGLPDRYWLHVGALAPRKNTLRVIEAYARAGAICRQARDPALGRVPRLVLVGSTPAMPVAVAERCRALGMGSDVAWLPAPLDAAFADVVRGAELLVAPSLHEGFGLVLVEAMASGTPVIASTGGGAAEVAGDAAWRVDAGDVESIADALVRLATDPSLRAELAARGLRQVARFDWQTVARDTAAVYAEVAGNGAC